MSIIEHGAWEQAERPPQFEPGSDPEDYGLATLVRYGYHAEFEAERARVLQEQIGPQGMLVAAHEQRVNREAWVKEFLKDEPVSQPRTYWHMGEGKLHSYPIEHTLTTVESGIHPDERDGLTTEGFRNYQELVTRGAGPDGVVMWYSPAGPGGTEGVFKDLYYESGRLYVGFNSGDETSVHFDIKIQEGEDVQFPINEFLNNMTSRQDDIYQHLREPMSWETKEDFQRALKHAVSRSSFSEDSPVYISRRHEKDKMKVHTWSDVMGEVFESIEESRLPDLGGSTVKTDAHEIHMAFQSDLHEFAGSENVDKLYLYGCSTTSELIGLNEQLSDGENNNGSLFSTARRLQSARGNENTENLSGRARTTCPNCKTKVEFNRSEVAKSQFLKCTGCGDCARGCNAVEIAKKADDA